jgi:two-component system response regulator FixJ
MAHDQSLSCIDESTARRRHVTAMAAAMGIAVAEYRSAEEFLEASAESRRGCLVLNARLPGLSGLDLLAEMEDWLNRPAVVLTIGAGDVSTAVRGMSLGAVAVLQAPCRIAEFRDAVHEAIGAANRRREHQARVGRIERGLATLTDEESKVLALVVAGQMNKGIAHSLGAGLRTVEMRRHSIMAKLGAHSLAELVRLICEARSPDWVATRSVGGEAFQPLESGALFGDAFSN